MAPVSIQRSTPAEASSGRPGQRRGLRHGLALAAVLFVGLLPAAPVHAAPTPEEIDAQIDKQWDQIEPTIEQFNKIRVQIKANQKKAADLEKKIQPLSLEAELSMNKVGSLASRYYKSGPGSNLNALLATGSASTLSDQLTLLDRLAVQERAQIADVIAVRDKYDKQKQELDALIAGQRKQEKELAEKRKHIESEIKRLTAMLPKTTVKVAGCPTISGVVNAAARTAIRVACAQVGKPYVFGADGPDSFDCSGLTQYAYAAAGVRLTHHTGDQWNEGRAISRADARPGDLVFFNASLSHVGLYLGNGTMVHAPRTGKPVQVSSTGNMPIAGFRRPG